MRLEYPLLEYEVVRHRHGAEIVDAVRQRARAPGAAARLGGDAMPWRALTAEAARRSACSHADATASGRQLDALDREVDRAASPSALSGVLERAVLRHTLDLHRAELSRPPCTG